MTPLQVFSELDGQRRFVAQCGRDLRDGSRRLRGMVTGGGGGRCGPQAGTCREAEPPGRARLGVKLGPVFAHDTPCGQEIRRVCIRAGHDLRMAAIAGRRRRASTGGVHVLLQGRVDPAIKERADRGAAARGVSIARYLEILIEGDEVADTYVEPDSCEQLDLGMSA